MAWVEKYYAPIGSGIRLVGSNGIENGMEDAGSTTLSTYVAVLCG